ncbi:hypothetical protein SAMN05444162_0362 [Paenibacillaceae bacterium GAS479]|nr:hypothetical protein SAMN05444162_0362 [Paenibacillaceae bacterium GAS479]
MTNESVTISNWGAGSNSAVVLVLFILLVIITSFVCIGGSNGNSPDEVNASIYETFNLNNNSSYLLRYYAALRGYLAEITPNIPPLSEGIVTIYSRSYPAETEVVYRVLDPNNNNAEVGRIQFTLRAERINLNVRYAVLNISSTAPILWNSSGNTLTVFNF